MSSTNGWPMADRVIVVHRSDVRSWRDNSASFDVEAVIPPSIAEVRLDVPAGVLTAVSAAERAMTELDTQLSHESTTAIEAATFALIRAESISSSRIEGLAVGSRRLAEAAHDPAIAKRLAREVASNVAALRHAIDLGSRRTPLGVDDILDIHSELMLRVPGVPAGEFRTVQSWIGRSNTPADAVYVPPPPDMVAALMDDLAEFLNRNDLPVVVQAAVAHAQFEAIHPFVDGNGRVGRCLVSVLLRRGATTEAIPPVSGVFASDTSAYFEALRQFQQEASPVPWLVQFAEATARACQVALTMTRDITELQAHWTRRAGNPRAGSIVARLIEVLPTMSVTDAAAVADRLGVDPNVARRGLNQLETAGILQTTAGRKRGRVWRAPEFHALLDAYSAGFSRTDPD